MDTSIFKNEDYFFEGYVKGWSVSCWSRWENETMLEGDISAAMCAFFGDLEEVTINFFCQKMGVKKSARYAYRLREISSAEPFVSGLLGSEVTSGKSTQRRPDIALTRTNLDSEQDELIGAVELKGNAQINYVNCPTGEHPHYSNQVICYTNGCWLDPEKVDNDAVKYLWLAPEQKLSTEKMRSVGIRADADHWTHNNGVSGSLEAFYWQENAWQYKWRKAAVQELCDVIAAVHSGLGEFAEAVRKWCSR
ncbi:hypothetical protein HF984_04980 [Rothia terrae]|uniref:hypothetical protein n=1 Tax=Rothia terrae TaxID=396015 RepID=UPI001448430D|nr:hypothetical protein [Rothia terrae]NKZ34124.1 hypothetical protein [Rothia terrae]